ncbi:MAG: glucans biosynthesis glucosyltransferase MdoH [Longimicrobiales bacterium]
MKKTSGETFSTTGTQSRNRRGIIFFALVLITTLAVSYLTGSVLSSGGITPLEVLILLLFSLTFCWITVSFWNAVIGSILMLFKIDDTELHNLKTPEGGRISLNSKTALIMLARNENPEQTLECLGSTLQSLIQTKQYSCFDAYLLSDSDDKKLCITEEILCENLSQSMPKGINLYYRNRKDNTGHKAGNIRDFCQRWGKNYEFMVILDSDSIMEGETLIELSSLMELNPTTGLIQTVPQPINQKTLFGRILQFSSGLYGPIVSWGQTFWYSNSSNYWGHNAIVRTSAFTDSCGLPNLPGEPPFGGEILSHDFVEASLLKRAGWDLFMLPHIKGSYEMVPEDMFSYVKRERRWAQGSLQHLRLLGSKNLHFMNRIHFLMGAMGYLSSVLWISLLISSTIYILSLETGTSFFFLAPFLHLSDFSENSSKYMLSPLLITGYVLFLPKFLSFMVAAIQYQKGFREILLIALSTIAETVFAILLAPILMFYHTAFILGFLSGGKINWNPSHEREMAVSWKSAFTNTAFITISCIVWVTPILWYSPSFFLWMLPVFIGPALANPIVCLTTRRGVLKWVDKLNLFLISPVTFSTILKDDVERTEAAKPTSTAASIRPPLENPTIMPTQSVI